MSSDHDSNLLLVPPALGPGSVVRVVAPSSPFERRLLWRALGWLAKRYCVRYERAVFERHGYLAGDDERRRLELDSALNEPGVAAVMCVRGGYGLSRIVDGIDWSVLRTKPRWVVGFSDVTVAHVEAAKQGVASIHGSNLGALGRGNGEARASMISVLEQPCAQRRFDKLRSIVPGEASGPMFGGNLTLLHASAAAGRLVVPEGAVLLLEDVTERPYRIDRMLTTLISGGHFAQLAAVVLGEFTDCHAGADGVAVEQVVAERLTQLGVPMAAQLPVGHGLRNEPMVLGQLVELRVDEREAVLTVGSAATRRPTGDS